LRSLPRLRGGCAVSESAVESTRAESNRGTCHESQLHFEEVPGGYRFGHPSIVKPIFEALTAAPGSNVPLAIRLARTLSSVLEKMDAVSRWLPIRQIPLRLEKRSGRITLDVLTALHQFNRGPACSSYCRRCVGSIGRLAISEKENRSGQQARTFRDNNVVESVTRARLAANLALRPAADRQIWKLRWTSLLIPNSLYTWAIH